MRIFADFASSSIGAGPTWKSAAVENQRPTLSKFKGRRSRNMQTSARLPYFSPAGLPTLVTAGRS